MSRFLGYIKSTLFHWVVYGFLDIFEYRAIFDGLQRLHQHDLFLLHPLCDLSLHLLLSLLIVHLLLDGLLLLRYWPPLVFAPVRVVLSRRVELRVIFRTVLRGVPDHLGLLVAAMTVSDPVNRSHRLDLARLHQPSVLREHLLVFFGVLELLPIFLL